MYIFAITCCSDDPAPLQEAINAGFDEKNILTLSPTNWLVATNQIVVCRDLYNHIAKDNDKGNCIVTKVEWWYGYHDKLVWEWITTMKDAT